MVGGCIDILTHIYTLSHIPVILTHTDAHGVVHSRITHIHTLLTVIASVLAAVKR